MNMGMFTGPGLCGIYFRFEETCRCKIFNSWQYQEMCSNLGVGKHPTYNLQLVILSLWGISSVIPLASIYLGLIPCLIFWQQDGVRASFCCYLDRILPGRSGLFTPPEAVKASTPSSRGGWSERHAGEERTSRTRRSRVKVVKNAAQVFSWCREGHLWDDRVSGRSGGKANPNVGMGWLLREDAGDGWWLLVAVIVFR